MISELKKVSEKAVERIQERLEEAAKDNKDAAEGKVPKELDRLPENYQIINDPQTYEIDIKEIEKFAEEDLTEVDKQISKIENTVFKHQLYHLKDNYKALFPVDPKLDENKNPIIKENDNKGVNPKGEYLIRRTSCEKSIRGLLVKKIVYTKDELQADKLNNIYSSIAELGTTLALCIHRTAKECVLTFLIKTNSVQDSKTKIGDNIETLQNIISGNFPGTQGIKFTKIDGSPKIYGAIPQINSNCPKEIADERGKLVNFRDNVNEQYSVADYLDEIFNPENCKAISVVTGIPALKSKDSKYMNQGIEKLIDGVVPSTDKENYTLLLLAEPLEPNSVAKMKNGYEQMASMLTPFQGFQYNQTLIDSLSMNTGESKNLSDQVSEAMAYSVGMGMNAGASANANACGGVNSSSGTNEQQNQGKALAIGTGSNESYNVKDGNILKRGGKSFNNIMGGGEKKGQRGTNTSTVTTDSNGTSKGTSNSCGNSFNAGANAGASIGVSANANMNLTITSGRSYCSGINYGLAKTLGKSESLTRDYSSIPVKGVLERLEKEIKRLDAGESAGLWRFSGYVIAGSRAMAQRVANSYQGMIQGEDSSVERGTINIWNHGSEDFNAIVVSLLNLEHPHFKLKDKQMWLPESVYCATEMSSAELALAMSWPQKAVSGLPVVSCASFGRNICTVNGGMKNTEGVRLGNLYHMLQAEKNIEVLLDRDKLTSHVFVTGSTGSGKSNVIYEILKELTGAKIEEKTDQDLGETKKVVVPEKNIKFMVIEPTKGEYKDVLGGWQNVKVYGTNQKVSNLLRINPFSFPENIHVLEHIDRLVEIFNACWPMYAAMPAILKDAIEQCYKEKGWDLRTSECETKRFPTFRNLMHILPEVIEKSNYSKDTSNDYIGALVTRVNSLTTGINGSIFNSVFEISSEELFDENVIVDLSRVGSSETKSLLMGILILKLQEHRMNERMLGGNGANSELKHITVLEEAHLLLRKTSMQQTQEGANLQGKSVEMLTNAIAEMRTYGEGFIIADQAPDLLDTAVIRNTNTKIILRLPDEGDRNLVGKAVALTPEQIDELSKLPNWVAVVYQSDWLEAVLCLVNRFDEKYIRKLNKVSTTNHLQMPMDVIFGHVMQGGEKLEEDEISKLSDAIKKMQIKDSGDVIEIVKKSLRGEQIIQSEKTKVIQSIFDWTDEVQELYEILQKDDNKAVDKFFECIQSEYNISSLSLTKKIMLHCFDDVMSRIAATNDEEKNCIEQSRLRRTTIGG